MEINWNAYDLNEAKEIALAFGKRVIEEWKTKLHQLDLVDSGKLLESLKATPKSTFDEVTRIEFRYEFYGKIWERGASNVFGKGTDLHAQPWRDEILEKLKPELDQEFGEFYAKLIIQELTIDSVTLRM